MKRISLDRYRQQLVWNGYIYVFVMLAANFVAGKAFYITWNKAFYPHILELLANPFLTIISLLICSAVYLAVSCIITAIYFSKVIDYYYDTEYTVRTVCEKAFLLIGFGEILRFIISSLPWKPIPNFSVPQMKFLQGIITYIPSFWFNGLYIGPKNDWDRLWAEWFTAEEHIVFALFYLVYFIVNCLLLCLVFGLIWIWYGNRTRRNEAIEIRITMDPGQMK